MNICIYDTTEEKNHVIKYFFNIWNAALKENLPYTFWSKTLSEYSWKTGTSN